MSPNESLELRLRALETIATGTAPLKAPDAGARSIARRADDATASFRAAVTAHDPIRRFVDGYELNAPLLRPPLPTDGHHAAGDEPAPAAEVKAALVLEAEADVRATERDLRELEALDKRGLAGAGTLAGHDALRPDLDKLRGELPGVVRSYAALEDRVTALLQRYGDHVRGRTALRLTAQVDAVSEIFIAWNALVSHAEDVATKLERARDA